MSEYSMPIDPAWEPTTMTAPTTGSGRASATTADTKTEGGRMLPPVRMLDRARARLSGVGRMMLPPLMAGPGKVPLKLRS